jgi:hypothetical protein
VEKSGESSENALLVLPCLRTVVVITSSTFLAINCLICATIDAGCCRAKVARHKSVDVLRVYVRHPDLSREHGVPAGKSQFT